MKNALWAIPFLAGCGSMLANPPPMMAEDGSRIYSIISLYDGEPGSREQAVKSMDIDATNLCGSGYTLNSEISRPIMNRIGEVTSSRLIWEIKCDPKTETAPALQ